MGEVRNGDQKVRKYLFPKIFYGRQEVHKYVYTVNINGRFTYTLHYSSFASHKKKLRTDRGSVLCVFSSHSLWTSSSLDVPAGVTQKEGHTGFLIHLLSAVRAFIFLARRIQSFLSLVDREVEFCVLTI